MSHYEFLLMLKKFGICYPYSPYTLSDGSFNVLVEDNEGRNAIDLFFDEKGMMIEDD